MKNGFFWALLATITTLSLVAIKVAANIPMSNTTLALTPTLPPTTLSTADTATLASPTVIVVTSPTPTSSATSSPIPTPSPSLLPSPSPISSPTAIPIPTSVPLAHTYKNGTFTGKSIYTPYGYVQVSTVIAEGAITSIQFHSLPRGSAESSSSSDKVQPKLLQETINAQNANVDIVSGATITSKAYIQSLTSALNPVQ